MTTSDPNDAYANLFNALPPSIYSTSTSTTNRIPPPPPSALSDATAVVVGRLSSRPRRRQVQKLTDAEAEAFEGLMSTFLPSLTSSSTSSSSTAIDPLGMRGSFPSGLTVIQDALRKKITNREADWMRKTRPALSRAEEERLDEMREVMMSFRTDYDLIRWSLVEILGFPVASPSAGLFPDPRSAPLLRDAFVSPSSSSSSTTTSNPFSPLYPDLLFTLFLLLRDTHGSPHSALHIFTLACLTSHSYVAGCTVALYNEVLRTKWMEGDVESVAKSLDEMTAAGIRINDGTREIVQAIGEAIRIDETRAEERAVAVERQKRMSMGMGVNELRGRSRFEEDESDDAVLDSYRLFSTSQIRAWARMDSLIEENLDERMRRKREKDAEERRDWQGRIDRERDDQSPRSNEEWNEEQNALDEIEVGDQDMRFSGEEKRRGEPYALSTPRVERSPASSLTINEKSAAMMLKERITPKMKESVVELGAKRKDIYIDTRDDNVAFSPQEQAEDEEDDEDDDDDRIESSWKNFPLKERTEEERAHRDAVAGPNRKAALEEYNASRSTPTSPQLWREERGSRSEDFFSQLRDKKKQEKKAVLGEDGKVLKGAEALPRRPAALNPFKIRRKGLTKAEKAAGDDPHPMMFWKKK